MIKLEFVDLVHNVEPHCQAIAWLEEKNGTNLHTPASARLLLSQANISAFVGLDSKGNAGAYLVWERRHRDLKLHTLVVLPNARRRGVGVQMVEHLLEKLDNRRTFMVVSIPEIERGHAEFFRYCGQTFGDVAKCKLRKATGGDYYDFTFQPVVETMQFLCNPK